MLAYGEKTPQLLALQTISKIGYANADLVEMARRTTRLGCNRVHVTMTEQTEICLESSPGIVVPSHKYQSDVFFILAQLPNRPKHDVKAVVSADWPIMYPSTANYVYPIEWDLSTNQQGGRVARWLGIKCDATQTERWHANGRTMVEATRHVQDGGLLFLAAWRGGNHMEQANSGIGLVATKTPEAQLVFAHISGIQDGQDLERLLPLAGIMCEPLEINFSQPISLEPYHRADRTETAEELFELWQDFSYNLA